MQAYAERLLVAQNLAQQAGAVIRDAHKSRNFQFETKSSPIDFVTEIDKECERLIVAGIQAEFPLDGIIGEEGTRTNEDAEFQWHIDPLDGTGNFVHGVPIFCTSIGITSNDEPVIGCIYDPIHDELYAAITGKGATCNGIPIKVRTADSQSLFMSIHARAKFKTDSAFMTPIAKIDCGSASLMLAWVADGRTDAMVQQRWNTWDYIGGVVLIREAGGVVIDYAGNPQPSPTGTIAASSLELAELVRAELA